MAVSTILDLLTVKGDCLLRTMVNDHILPAFGRIFLGDCFQASVWVANLRDALCNNPPRKLVGRFDSEAALSMARFDEDLRALRVDDFLVHWRVSTGMP